MRSGYLVFIAPLSRIGAGLAVTLAAGASWASVCDEMPSVLATMRSVDQSLREQVIQSGFADPRLNERIALIDRTNTKKLADFLSRCGWPSVKRHGQQASQDAWLLAQHADHDRPFQRRALRLLEAAVKSGDASGWHLAYLSDRLAVADGKPQPYGTQFKLEGCRLELMPIDSRDAVNRRRGAIPGMPTLEAYEAEAQKHVLPPECTNTR